MAKNKLSIFTIIALGYGALWVDSANLLAMTDLFHARFCESQNLQSK